MNTVFRIVHVQRNKVEQDVALVRSRRDVDYIVESPRYVGTWLNANRKLLRYGLGEIHIREEFARPAAGDHAFEEINGRMTVLLSVKYDRNIDWIRISEDRIAAYNLLKDEPLWTVTSFPLIAKYTDKDIAYKCMRLYEKLLSTYNLEGAL